MHAVVGGVGLLLTQIIRARGGRVIGLTSSETKRQEALHASQFTASIGATFPLADGAAAHRLLESRMSTGKILLLP